MSNIPLYKQLIYLMQRKISQKEWKVGDSIPPVTELAAKYKVSINTVRAAIKKLEKDKVIIRLTDKQLYVSNTELRHEMKLSSGFTETLINTNNPKLWCKVIKKKVYLAGEIYSKKFNIDPQDQIIFIKKVLYADKAPIAIEYIYIPKKEINSYENIDLSIFSFNKNYTFGHNTKKIYQSLKMVKLENRDAKLLNLEKESISILLTGTVYDSNQIPLEIKKIYVNIDKISFNVNFDSTKR